MILNVFLLFTTKLQNFKITFELLIKFLFAFLFQSRLILLWFSSFGQQNIFQDGTNIHQDLKRNGNIQLIYCLNSIPYIICSRDVKRKDHLWNLIICSSIGSAVQQVLVVWSCWRKYVTVVVVGFQSLKTHYC